jgi:cysteine desulfurase/selenocysteine lyase
MAAAELLNAMPPWHGGWRNDRQRIARIEHLQATAAALRSRHTKHRWRDRPRCGFAITSTRSGETASSRMTWHLRGKRSIASPKFRVCGFSVRAKNAAGWWAFVGDWAQSARSDDLRETNRDSPCAGGHHCNQPLMRRFGVTGTSRASFYFYNTPDEVDRMIDIIARRARFFA